MTSSLECCCIPQVYMRIPDGVQYFCNIQKSMKNKIDNTHETIFMERAKRLSTTLLMLSMVLSAEGNKSSFASSS